MGGTISVISSPGQGSTFTFRLPLATVDQVPTSASARPAKHSIALVAAPALWRDVLRSYLDSQGHEVTCLSAEQLLAREPKQLFVAGNHTIVIADYRELLSQHPSSLPVVERVILVVPMILARPTHNPTWLKHADVRWLQRPIARLDLHKALSDEAPVETSIATGQQARIAQAGRLMFYWLKTVPSIKRYCKAFSCSSVTQ